MSLSFPRSTVILPFRYGIPSLGVRSNFPSSTVSSLELRCISLQVRLSFPLKYGRAPPVYSHFSLEVGCPFPFSPAQRITLQSPLTCHFFVLPVVVRWVSNRPFH